MIILTWKKENRSKWMEQIKRNGFLYMYVIGHTEVLEPDWLQATRVWSVKHNQIQCIIVEKSFLRHCNVKWGKLQIVIVLVTYYYCICRHLVKAGVLVVRDVGSWWFTIPGAGIFMKSHLRGRKAVLTMIRKCKYREILQGVIFLKHWNKIKYFT